MLSKQALNLGIVLCLLTVGIYDWANGTSVITAWVAGLLTLDALGLLYSVNSRPSQSQASLSVFNRGSRTATDSLKR